MTESKKTNKKKEVNKNIDKPTSEIVKEVKQVKRKKQLDQDILIPCRNVTDGMLVYISKKTGLETTWVEHDAEEYLTVGELLTMRASQPKFLTEPWLVIDDEDASEYLDLKKLYDKLVGIEDLDEFFEKPVSEMEEILNKIPRGLKETIGIRARKKIEDESLYDTRKIKLIEEKLKIDLSILL
ncbi:hypothetical protein JK635_01895 [Neobacillus sp. YIM B02564]|uniref:Uncharacterized protein n=1 Tax=Neobacillus paridis TaxID=2803862 RepID=A0ABS1TI49_9BACI|nr:hypothetical protein [Neobacillus paridis]MBL4950991.1 hypothetical protein [Neobacillus paridis]